MIFLYLLANKHHRKYIKNKKERPTCKGSAGVYVSMRVHNNKHKICHSPMGISWVSGKSNIKLEKVFRCGSDSIMEK